MDKNVVNWFEIPVEDLARAKEFYGKLLDVTLEDLNMPNSEMAAFPMIQGGEFSTGALIKSEGYKPSQTGTTVYFGVEDVNQNLEKVERLGGSVIFPKTSIGDHGFISHIIDTEGNRIALHSAK